MERFPSSSPRGPLLLGAWQELRFGILGSYEEKGREGRGGIFLECNCAWCTLGRSSCQGWLIFWYFAHPPVPLLLFTIEMSWTLKNQLMGCKSIHGESHCSPMSPVLAPWTLDNGQAQCITLHCTALLWRSNLQWAMKYSRVQSMHCNLEMLQWCVHLILHCISNAVDRCATIDPALCHQL